MTVTFNIDYHTSWGESLYIYGNIPELGDNDPKRGLKMTLEGYERWSAQTELPFVNGAISYGYAVVNENGSVVREWGPSHTLQAGGKLSHIVCYDRWQDQPADKPFYSSAIVNCLNRRENRAAEVKPATGYLTLSIEAPMIAPDEVLAVSGSNREMGYWDVNRALVMSDAEFPIWKINLDVNDLPAGTEFKFVVLDAKSRSFKKWQNGDNLKFPFGELSSKCATTYSGLRFNNPGPLWRGAGVAIPVFSIRTEEDFGVGDFADIKKLVDWARLTGQNFIQILPINDTTMTRTWTDSYPYNANSTFALHPMFLRPSALGTLKDAKRRNYYENLRKELNALPTVDYERVNNAKDEFTREIFAQEGPRVVSSAPFKEFVERNIDWLKPYAAFCVLRDKFHTPDMSKWGEYAEYSPAKVDKFIAENESAINFVYYQQYNLDLQLRDSVDYAHRNRVALKGDIPIGISRHSADAWVEPRLFNLSTQAGAPPDDFSVLGQNWGFPTYNWEEMSKDGFNWWKRRFRKMSEYFDAYRIDHVLGFFRIWQIPMDALHGLLGIFHPALPFTPDELRNNYDFWIDVNLQTTPFIYDWMLGDFFGEYASEARERFLEEIGGGRLKFKPEFDTQRKVADYFGTQELNDKDSRLCNGLLGLADQVLFIEDPYEKGKYHPRISAQFTYTYRVLNDYEKWCFDRLYNDFFYRRHNDFWYGKAMWKLVPLVDSTNMLTCAEDLGMIPDCVPAVMNKLEMLALEIQRMPKDPKAKFGDTYHYPYYSVCTTSTHDMGGIRAWWEENRETTQQYYNNVMHCGGEAPYFAEPWVCERIVDMHFKSPSMLCILPLQDMLSIDGNIRREMPGDEQINVPANPRHYWRYRMHLTVEQLMGAAEFNSRLSAMIKNSGR